MEGVKKQALKIFIFVGCFGGFFHRPSSWQQSWSKLLLCISPSPKFVPASESSPHLCHRRYLWSYGKRDLLTDHTCLAQLREKYLKIHSPGLFLPWSHLMSSLVWFVLQCCKHLYSKPEGDGMEASRNISGQGQGELFTSEELPREISNEPQCEPRGFPLGLSLVACHMQSEK